MGSLDMESEQTTDAVEPPLKSGPAPPEPKLLDRTAGARSPRPSFKGQLPETRQHLNRPEGVGGDSKNLMKQTQAAVDDIALRKLVHSNNQGLGHQSGRLALSKQSSRFELPMDMMALETLTPQEYLRRYCIVSSRRQNLYLKMFNKNKEAKKSTIQMKELVKALRDVLTDTLDEAMLNLVLDMVQIEEETAIDQKLFYGVAALAERMLYAKFVTEDTADLTDHQKERIECADFFALDWKFHGVKVNPCMERLLRAL